MTIVVPQREATFAQHGVEFIGLAAPSRGSKDNAVWRVRLSPGTAGTLHSVDREEIFVAIAGAAEVTMNGEQLPLAQGSALIVPAGQPFALANPSSDPFEAVVVLPVGARARVGSEPPFAPPWTL